MANEEKHSESEHNELVDKLGGATDGACCYCVMSAGLELALRAAEQADDDEALLSFGKMLQDIGANMVAQVEAPSHGKH